MSLDLINYERDNFVQSCKRLSIVPSHQFLIISISQQKLFLFSNELLVKSYTLSTSINKPSCLKDSFGTPLGLHKIAEKIGDGVEKGTVFKARIAQDYTYWEAPISEQSENLITSRIIRIKGLDPELNLHGDHDSFNRYIYIHGTNHEDQLGKPFSKGCIELSNDDCIALFECVQLGSLIWIE